MADKHVRYAFRYVRSVRGREARAAQKWKQRGWDLVAQRPSRMMTTELVFRRVAARTRRRLVVTWGGSILLVIVLATVAAMLRFPGVDGPAVDRLAGRAVAADRDGDGMSDLTEVVGWRTNARGSFVTDPHDPDTDGDGLTDGQEAGQRFLDLMRIPTYAGFSDPTATDSDGDALDDASEHDGGFDPWAQDTDGDGLDDFVEIDFGSDPLATNADGDHLDDAEELHDGGDPNVYDLTGNEAIEAFLGGLTFNFLSLRDLSDEQRDSWPYLAGSVAKSLAPYIRGVNRLVSKAVALRRVVSQLSSREWRAALTSLVGTVTGQEVAKTSKATVTFAARGDRATRAAMHFVATAPALSDGVKADVIRTIVRLSPATAQLGADEAVRGDPAPAALSTQRPIGDSDTQNAHKDEIVSELQSQGYTDLRVNQQQVDAAGQLVGVNWPDIQATAPDGTRHYYVVVAPGSDRGSSHLVRILSNDDGGEVHLVEQA